MCLVTALSLHSTSPTIVDSVTFGEYTPREHARPRRLCTISYSLYVSAVDLHSLHIPRVNAKTGMALQHASKLAAQHIRFPSNVTQETQWFSF